MITYTYRARDARGQTVSGVVDAITQTEAVRRLQREGKIVTDIHVGARPLEAQPAPAARGVTAASARREEVIALASQLSVMIETGVTLPDALDAFLKHSKGGGLRSVMVTVAERISAGMPFSAAISEYPRIFPTLMVSLMKASEATGQMGLMLRRIGEYLGKERRTARQIRGALTYPLVMVTLALVVTAFLVTWVLPRFAKIYETRQAALPTLTRYVIRASDFVGTHWLLILTAIAAAAGGFVALRVTVGGRRTLDWCKLKAPVLGPMFRQFYLTRATRTLGTLLAAGVGLLDAVRITRGVTENIYWQELWDELDRAMTGGRTISEVINASWLIPPPVAQMITAGERSGRLPDVLEKVSLATEADLDEAVKGATQLIEPLMIIFMGATIGGIAIALLLPIFNVSNAIAH